MKSSALSFLFLEGSTNSFFICIHCVLSVLFLPSQLFSRVWLYTTFRALLVRSLFFQTWGISCIETKRQCGELLSRPRSHCNEASKTTWDCEPATCYYHKCVWVVLPMRIPLCSQGYIAVLWKRFFNRWTENSLRRTHKRDNEVTRVLFRELFK